MTRPEAAANAGDEAYQRLRQDLLAGRLLPGQRLVETEIVDALGVGRAVVRAALSRLAHDGLVDKEPNRGARVRMVSEDEAIEITQARAVLEALAARHAAINAGPEDIEVMRDLLAEMRELLSQHDLLAYSECNGRLHQRILTASRHTTAQRLITNLRAQMVRFQYRTILVRGRANGSLAEHTAIVDAIVARDPDKADAEMRNHLAHVADTLVRTRDAASLAGSGAAPAPLGSGTH
ncbi:MAG: FCD domain-containing protein [Micromonosporaceae bacterium]|nr:FCD domain-containing protein [Micromonosporaceae bacterium]